MDKDIRPVRFSAGWQDNTLYIVEYATGGSARETPREKIKRLIMNEPITSGNEAS